jgi:hypothetical protein
MGPACESHVPPLIDGSPRRHGPLVNTPSVPPPYRLRTNQRLICSSASIIFLPTHGSYLSFSHLHLFLFFFLVRPHFLLSCDASPLRLFLHLFPLFHQPSLLLLPRLSTITPKIQATTALPKKKARDHHNPPSWAVMLPPCVTAGLR